MFSGITSFLFGSSAAPIENKEEETVLTTVADDNEWLLVDVADDVPLPIECCPLVAHLEDSIHEAQSSVGVISRNHGNAVERHRHTTAPRRKDAYIRALASGRGTEIASRRFLQQPRGPARKSFERTNRVHEHLSHCKRQRRYNYKLCYSAKHQRSC